MSSVLGKGEPPLGFFEDVIGRDIETHIECLTLLDQWQNERLDDQTLLVELERLDPESQEGIWYEIFRDVRTGPELKKAAARHAQIYALRCLESPALPMFEELKAEAQATLGYLRLHDPEDNEGHEPYCQCERCLVDRAVEEERNRSHRGIKEADD